MADRFVGSEALTTHAVGDKDSVPEDLNNNMSAVKTVVNRIGDTVDGLTASTGALQVDAGNSIENVLMNGAFMVRQCGGDQPFVVTPIRHNERVGRLAVMIPWCDGWFFEPDTFTVSPFMTSIDVVQNGATGDIQIGKSLDPSFTGALTGVVYQRVDYWIPRDYFRGQSFTFAIMYTASTDGEFYLEIDDGVGVTQSVASDHAAGVDSQAFVQHIIDPSATKLVMRIVTAKDAVDGSGPNVLKIRQAYGKFGLGIPILPAQVTIPQINNEFWRTRTMHQFFYEHEMRKASATLAGVEQLRDNIDLIPPMVCRDSTDVVVDHSHTGDGSLTSVTITNVSIGQTIRGQMLDYQEWPWVYSSLEMSYDRPSSVDPNNAGFSANARRVWVNVIPAA